MQNGPALTDQFSFRTAVLLPTRDLERWVHPSREAFSYGIAKDDFKSWFLIFWWSKDLEDLWKPQLWFYFNDRICVVTLELCACSHEAKRANRWHLFCYYFCHLTFWVRCFSLSAPTIPPSPGEHSCLLSGSVRRGWSDQWVFSL